ncbi:putative 26S Proteasome non-ATPase regulatory subunit 13 [Helianthus debilis subsp. tardiflorus]
MDALCDEHPELFDWCDTLYDLYQRKLWQELTFYLQRFIFLPVFQTDDNLIQQLYHNFIIHFETEINPLKLAQIVATISNWKDDVLKGLLRSSNLQTRRIYYSKPELIIYLSNKENFSSILEHLQAKSLLGSPYEWLYQMLEAFNSGSQELCTLHKISVDAELALVENEKKLVEKINILGLIDF